MRQASYRVGLLLILGCVIGQPLRSQSCDSLLAKGIFDIYDNASTSSSLRTYMDAFCDTQFGSRQEADEFGASLAFPYKGIPVKLGFDSSSSSWSDWYKQICAEHRAGSMDYSSVRSHVKQVNPAVVAAFEKCVSADGLHVWLERSGGSRFHVAARFVNPGNYDLPTIIEFVTPAHVKCALQLQGKEISGATYRVPCDRMADDPVLITVNATTNPLGGGSLSLPAVWEAPPPEALAFKSLLDQIAKSGAVPAGNYIWKGHQADLDALEGGALALLEFLEDNSNYPRRDVGAGYDALMQLAEAVEGRADRVVPSGYTCHRLLLNSYRNLVGDLREVHVGGVLDGPQLIAFRQKFRTWRRTDPPSPCIGH